MGDLSTRTDDASVQIMAESSARFFVRVTSTKSNKTSLVFSDFILNPDDDDRAVEALHLLKKQGFPLSAPVKLVFQDIYPSYYKSRDRAELVRRHDQIVAVVKEYATQEGLVVTNTFLDSKAGRFETQVLIE